MCVRVRVHTFTFVLKRVLLSEYEPCMNLDVWDSYLGRYVCATLCGCVLMSVGVLMVIPFFNVHYFLECYLYFQAIQR